MQNYEPIGPKEDDYTEYQTLAFIDRNIENIHPEDVDLFSSAVAGRILRWV